MTDEMEKTLKWGQCGGCEAPEGADVDENHPCERTHTVVYKNLIGREPLDLQEKATTFNPRTKEMAIDTAILIWERLQARVLLVDGNPPVWDKMEEEETYALTVEFGFPPVSPKG
ncbi:MAG: hypothetical protein LN413_03860 [Candidatus Thermoplasmatota archaeon]|nr:hypothetical protein [Candidatus Thermoplasmatota archaeon]